jgi:hypothetical protein
MSNKNRTRDLAALLSALLSRRLRDGVSIDDSFQRHRARHPLLQFSDQNA